LTEISIFEPIPAPNPIPEVTPFPAFTNSSELEVKSLLLIKRIPALCAPVLLSTTYFSFILNYDNTCSNMPSSGCYFNCYF